MFSIIVSIFGDICVSNLLSKNPGYIQPPVPSSFLNVSGTLTYEYSFAYFFSIFPSIALLQVGHFLSLFLRYILRQSK